MSTSNETKSREILGEKLRAINWFISHQELLLEHAVLEFNKLEAKLRYPEPNCVLDELNRIFDEICVAGSPPSLIHEDLNDAENRLGAEFAQSRDAKNERLTRSIVTMRESKAVGDIRTLALAIGEIVASIVPARRAWIEPALLFRREIIDKLENSGSVPTVSEGYKFKREGEVWQIVYNDKSFALKNCKGLFYIYNLLQTPGRVFEAEDLITLNLRYEANIRTAQSNSPDEQLTELNLKECRNAGVSEPVLDDVGKANLGKRLREIVTELTEAKECNDFYEIRRLERESETIRNHLEDSQGLGGRTRSNSAHKRPLDSVRKAIKTALKKISEASPELGEKFRVHIKIDGTFSYQTVSDETWIL